MWEKSRKVALLIFTLLSTGKDWLPVFCILNLDKKIPKNPMRMMRYTMSYQVTDF